MLILIDTEAYESDFAGDPTEAKCKLSFVPTAIALMEDFEFLNKKTGAMISCCRIYLQGVPKPIHIAMSRKDMTKFIDQLWQSIQQRQAIQSAPPIFGR